MHRIQAFEFNERGDVPRFVRDSIVEILGNGLRWGRVLEAAGPAFLEFCGRARCDAVLDLCSGTGEPASTFLSSLPGDTTSLPDFYLSDLFPNVEAMDQVRARHPGKVRLITRPVDATNVPPEVDRPARTIINALHHFPPALAQKILADCVAKGRAVFVIEAMQRKPLHIFSLMPFFTAAFFANPFLCPRDRALKLFFSHVVPVIGWCGMWDAAISMMRAHSADELMEMVRPFGKGYEWEFLEANFFPGGRNMVFFGVPKRR